MYVLGENGFLRVPAYGLVFVMVLLPTSLWADEKARIAVLPVQVEESAKAEVPELFDDYLLTAVQDLGSHEVIGQDDIDAMLGFEKQKDLLGCADTTCFAELGGALGVDEIMLMRVARIVSEDGAHEWVVTSKLIDIVMGKTKARSTDFVGGDIKALLKALPALLKKLFAGGGGGAELQSAAQGPTKEVSPMTEPVKPPPTENVLAQVVANKKKWANIWTYTGVTLAALGCLGMLRQICPGGDCTSPDRDDMRSSAAFSDLGLLLTGYGSGRYIDAHAVTHTGSLEAKGKGPMRLWAWLGAVFTMIGANFCRRARMHIRKLSRGVWLYLQLFLRGRF